MNSTLPDIRTEIEARKDRWRRFINNDNPPRFVFRVWVGDGDDARPRPESVQPWPSLKRERIEWAWENYVCDMEKAAWLNDDHVPYMSNMTGTEIFAEALGCEVARPADNMPYARARVHAASDADGVEVPELSSSSLAVWFEIADELRARGGEEAAIKMVDVQSPMDIAALVWDKNDLFPSMISDPEVVKELASKCCDLLIAFHDEWFARYGKGRIAHYPDYYLDRGITLSEDEIGSVSPDMFDEFFLPGLSRLSNRYDGIGIHCCAKSRHQWERMKNIPEFLLFNIGQPEEILAEAYEFFDGDVVHHHHSIKAEPSWKIADIERACAREIAPGRRSVIRFHAEDREHAVRLCDMLNEMRS